MLSKVNFIVVLHNILSTDINSLSMQITDSTVDSKLAEKETWFGNRLDMINLAN
jgi:hypothetical protein